MIRVEGNDLILADLTTVLDHIVNEQGQISQQVLTMNNDLEELKL